MSRNFTLLLQFYFSSSHCFVRQISSLSGMSTTTVFDVVPKNKSTSWMIQQLTVNLTLLWNWFMDFCTFAQRALLLLGNLKHIFMWVCNGRASSENLAFSLGETSFALLSLCCLGSSEKAIPQFNCYWSLESAYFDFSFLISQFFKTVFKLTSNFRPTVSPLWFLNSPKILP